MFGPRKLDANAYRTHEFGDSILVEKTETRDVPGFARWLPSRGERMLRTL